MEVTGLDIALSSIPIAVIAFILAAVKYYRLDLKVKKKARRIE